MAYNQNSKKKPKLSEREANPTRVKVLIGAIAVVAVLLILSFTGVI